MRGNGLAPSKLTLGRLALLVVALAAAGWFLQPAIRSVFKPMMAQYVIWPSDGGFAELALDAEASLVIADFRSHVLDESRHAKYAPLKNAGKIIEIPKNADAEALDCYVVKEGRARRDIPTTPALGRLEDGAIEICRVKISSGPKRGVMGWLPRGDLTGKYPMP